MVMLILFILKRLLKPRQDELKHTDLVFRDYIYLLFNKTNKLKEMNIKDLIMTT